MSLSREQKQTIINDFQHNQKDTGSAEIQIALLTKRITSLSEHLKTHSKDFHSRRGLLQQVSTRKSLLAYLKRTKPENYKTVVEKLGLRH